MNGFLLLFRDTRTTKKIYRHRIMTQWCEMPSFECFGKNCGFKTSAPTEAELMTKIAEHAKTAHKMDPIPPDVMVKVKTAIKK
jgi:predicted small metal-binding protein